MRSSSDPWARLRQDLRALGGGAERLSEGRARLDGTKLLIQLAAGRALAEAKGATSEPAVVTLVRQHYPEVTTIEAAALPGTGSQKEQSDALRRQVLADPRIQEILTTLDGELQRVFPRKE